VNLGIETSAEMMQVEPTSEALEYSMWNLHVLEKKSFTRRKLDGKLGQLVHLSPIALERPQDGPPKGLLLRTVDAGSQTQELPEVAVERREAIVARLAGRNGDQA